MRGGYKLIDCGGKNINAVGGVIILGIFSAILAHNGKNIKLTQFCIGTEKCNDACVNCEPVNANKYRIREFYGSDYYITSDDKIERSNSQLVTRDELESYVENELENYEVLGTDILSGAETAGKVLTSDGDGGSVWATPETPSGGTKLYKHTITGFIGGGGVYQIPFEIVTESNTPFASLDDVIQASPDAISIAFYGKRIIGILDGTSEQNGEILFLFADWDSTATPSFKVAYYSYTKASITVTDTVTEF